MGKLTNKQRGRLLKKEKEIFCPNCNSKMALRRTTKFRLKDGQARVFYGCSNFPVCKGAVGSHPDGTPFIPVDDETKKLRQEAHRIAELIWGEWASITKEQKFKMYSWLKENSQAGHIGQMEKQELIILIEKLNSKLQAL